MYKSYVRELIIYERHFDVSNFCVAAAESDNYKIIASCWVAGLFHRHTLWSPQIRSSPGNADSDLNASEAFSENGIANSFFLRFQSYFSIFLFYFF